MDITLQPNPKQLEFFAAQEKYVFYGGAKGGGKSWCIRWKQIHRRLKYPKSRGLLLRRTYPELLRTHIEKVLQELDTKIFKYDNQKHFLYFPNGSVLEFGSCQYEQDVKQYQGAEYDDIGIDEVTQFTEYQFNILKSILRTTRAELKTQMYLAANPGGVGHGWVKRLFIDQKLPDHRFVPAKVYDNPVLMQADPEYVKQLEKLPDHSNVPILMVIGISLQDKSFQSSEESYILLNHLFPKESFPIFFGLIGVTLVKKQMKVLLPAMHQL